MAEALIPDASLTTLTAQSGNSLISLLQGVGISATAAQTAIDALAAKWNPRGLKTGQAIALTYDQTGVKSCAYRPISRTTWC